MHLNPLVCKKIRPRYIALKGRLRSLVPSPDRKILAPKSLCGGASNFSLRRFPPVSEFSTTVTSMQHLPAPFPSREV
jgi:hypothetical protein